ncbi:class I SAM-dependent methyltransferase [Anaerosolibacter sp.]|uniref:class I SAM-dependent methyltransferase n=1 Tax=Anaerosolibacter sp. TaxID=1872527 RepID=UPI0039F06419
MDDFTALFDQWASSYDQTVYGSDNEYSEVFENYDGILNTMYQLVADKRSGTILEIGTGTGNLTKLLYDTGFNVIGVEPSQEMRRITRSKLPSIEVINGHFLQVPIARPVDAIVTSYAFHHLNLTEKRNAIEYLDRFLNKEGKIVIADTMFESEEYKRELYKKVEASKSFALLNDLNTEYYEYLKDVCKIFEEFDYRIHTTKMNKYVWIIAATKGGK